MPDSATIEAAAPRCQHRRFIIQTGLADMRKPLVCYGTMRYQHGPNHWVCTFCKRTTTGGAVAASRATVITETRAA